MRIFEAILWSFAALMGNASADAPAPRIEGQWTTEYRIVDVTNATVTDRNRLKALKMWIGHRYGARNCVEAGDASNLLQSTYPYDPAARSSVKFNENGGFTATSRYSGGFAIPGRGKETIVGVVDGDHLEGVVDIELDWEGGTHIRAVLVATRSGPCK